jgi:hypothetical protein
MKALTKLCRQNTGSHMCDSGSAYGYHYQRAIPKELITIDVDFDRNTVSATINTPVWLPEVLDVDNRSQRILNNLNRKFPEDSWDDLIDKLSDKLDLKVRLTENTYNGENDLSQNILYTVLSNSDDWYYDDDAVIIVRSHNGCDVRGGYSNPICCKASSEDTFFNIVVGWYVVNGEPIEEIETGYSHNPTYELSNLIKRVIDRIGDEIEIETVDGKIIWITPYVNTQY